jgi:HEPN domain-containing protein
MAVEEPSASVFHSQQCPEKSEKALLTLHGEVFRRTHDLKELGEQCALLQPPLTPILTEAASLTDYALAYCYQDAPREPDETEAVGALAIARRVYELVRELVDAGEDGECHGDNE